MQWIFLFIINVIVETSLTLLLKRKYEYTKEELIVALDYTKYKVIYISYNEISLIATWYVHTALIFIGFI